MRAAALPVDRVRGRQMSGAKVQWEKTPTSSMNSTPGTSSAVPWSMYLFTTCVTARQRRCTVICTNAMLSAC